MCCGLFCSIKVVSMTKNEYVHNKIYKWIYLDDNICSAFTNFVTKIDLSLNCSKIVEIAIM